MCSGSACSGYPSCINQANLNDTGGSHGCSREACYSSCGTSACDNMCYSTCDGLATFYFLYFF